MCCIILPPPANYVKSSAAVSNCFKLREPQRLSVSSCLEPHYVSQTTTNGRVGSLHLHLRSIQLQSQAKWRAQRLSNAIGGGCLCVKTLLPNSIKSLGLWVYTQQTASSHSVNIWEKEKVCLVWGCLRFSFLWLRRCPQLPVSVCQSGGRSENRLLLLLGYQRGQSIATATKLKAHRSPTTLLYCEIWSLEPPLGNTKSNFPPHVCPWHAQILNGCFKVIAPVIILISG